MGIDAQILVRNVPTETVTREWLVNTSWALCKAIGAEHFYVSGGDEARPFDAWSEQFNALWAMKKATVPHNELRAAVVAEIGEVPAQEQLAIFPSRPFDDDNTLAPGSVYVQDGPDIKARPGECLLELSVSTRYYGEGYERGDILTLCAMAEWLEVNIPGCEVWYGGDSSGVLAELFDEAARAKLRRHLYSSSGRDYFNEWSLGNDNIPRPAPCSICPGGKYCGTRHGWGQGYASYSCAGCGKSVETRDSGATYTPAKRS